MRRSLAIVGLAAALSVAAWLIVHRSNGSATPALRPDHATSPEDRASPSLDAPAQDASGRSAGTASSIGAEPSAVAAERAASDAPTLIVHLVSKADHAPLPRVRVKVRLATSEVDGWKDVDATRSDIDHAPISDAAGRVEIEVPDGQALYATASSEAAGCGSASAEIRALDAHEKRSIELLVPCGEDLRFFGRLLDSESREPVVGAHVKLTRLQGGKTDEKGNWTPTPRTLSEVRTGTSGEFDMSLSSWMQPYLRIEADGCGPLMAIPQPGHDTRANAQVLLVSLAGTLRVHVIDATGKPIADARVILKTRGYELMNGGDVLEPGTWIPFPDEEWKADLDGRGTCTISALPARVPLALEIRRGDRLLRREEEPLQLEPGKVLERTWTIGAGARIEGRVIDQFTAPVVNHEVWLFRSTGPGNGYVDPSRGESATAKAVSDSGGSFVLEDVPVGKWFVAAAPAADRAAVPGPDDVASWTQMIDVTSASTLSITLTVTRGLLVRGRVLDPDGNGVAGDYVTCTQNGEWFPAQTKTGGNGDFVMGPLAPGTCLLWADSLGAFAGSDQVSAEPGQTDVVLRLHAAGRITGQVVDAASGKPCAATVHVTPEHPRNNPEGGEFETETRDDARFLLENLEPDRYHLSFVTTDGRFASLSNIVVTAGQDSADHVAKVVPGGTLSIRYEGKGAGARYTLREGASLLGFPKDLAPGDPEVRPVPAGRITIEYSIASQKVAHTISADVPVGETREIVLRDDG